MSDITMNRKQRRAAQACARRAEKSEFGSQEHDRKTRMKARKAFDIIKEASHTRLGTRTNLYSKCAAGVAVFETLRGRGVPKVAVPFTYTSLRGQQTALLFAEATLDNMLTVLIEERPDRKWSWDIVVDNGLIFGSCEMEPCASYEEAEERAWEGLRMIGRAAEPASDYVPEPEPEKRLQIRVDRTTYKVPNVTADPRFEKMLVGAIKAEGTTFDGLIARFANLVLVEGADSHPVALAVLANCGWTHLTQQLLEDFCDANGIVDLEKVSDTPKQELPSPVIH